MEIKAYSELRELSLTKVKNLCKKVLGSVPQTLTDEQIYALDTALAQASQEHLPPSEQKALVANGSNNSLDSNIQKEITQIIGVDTLKKNAVIYQQVLLRVAGKSLLDTENILTQMQNAQASMVAKTYDSMTRNLIAVNQEFNVGEIDLMNPDTFSLDSLSQEDKDSVLAELELLGIKVD